MIVNLVAVCALLYYSAYNPHNGFLHISAKEKICSSRHETLESCLRMEFPAGSDLQALIEQASTNGIHHRSFSAPEADGSEILVLKDPDGRKRSLIYIRTLDGKTIHSYLRF